MANTAASLRNGLNLAYWLFRVHPQLFEALRAPAAKYSAKSAGLGRLGDDLFDTGASYPTFEVASDTSAISGGSFSDTIGATYSPIDPSLVSMPDPGLTDIGIDAATAQVSVPSIDSAVATPATTPASAGALSSVGSFLASVTGLTSLTNLATAIVKSNTPQAATIATQVARVQNGVSPAPITYAYNSAGQLVPVLATGTSAPMALTSQTLSNLIPSSVSSYAIPIGLGLLLVWALSSRK